MDVFNQNSLVAIVYAFIGGILPALIWLYFWNREDKKSPEPKGMILLAFIGGVIAVFISLYFEKIAFENGPGLIAKNGFLDALILPLKNFSAANSLPLGKVLLVACFAPIIEETAKFAMACLFTLRSKADDEPIDPIIYMITTALGFAAVENALFLIDPLTRHDFIFSILTSNMRFIGATLLHTISSATIGFFIGFHFFKRKPKEYLWGIFGLVCAIIIHAFFNLFMVGNAQSSFTALEVIWVLVIFVLLAFEKIKRVRLEKIS